MVLHTATFSNFEVYYSLRINKSKKFIQGIDLDIEEEIPLDDIRLLIKRIREDLGENFIISTAPIQSSLKIFTRVDLSKGS